MGVNNIIIVGGGTAGYMTAATLVKCFPHKKITLIESPNIPTVGVGESTIGTFRGWQTLIGIKDKDFLEEAEKEKKELEESYQESKRQTEERKSPEWIKEYNQWKENK